MKKLSLILTSIVFALLFSCNKEKELASIKTTEIENITDTTAVIKGKIVNDGNSEIINSGIAWSLNPNPTKEDNFSLANNIENISIQLSNLSPITTYYVRAFVENGVGISYGNELEFSTTHTIISNQGQGVTDIDGNFYETIVLGNGQEWMAENLRTTTCSDGTIIPNVENDSVWRYTSDPAWSYFDNDSFNEELYGKLYNWHAVGECSVCPEGWKVPSIEDWLDLIIYLDPNSDLSNLSYISKNGGGKLKSIGTIQDGNGLWKSPNEGATDEIDFKANPGGFRVTYGSFNALGNYSYFWTSNYNTEYPNSASAMFLQYSSALFREVGEFKESGLSIRCLKE